MSEFTTFVQLGFRHIANPEALDHILFLLALAAIYRLRDWRSSLWTISAFTVGHSITLALAVTHALALPARLVEFLIPLTIVAAALENLAAKERGRVPWRGRYRPVLAGAFGLVHGAGFATYLNSLFMDHLAVPLFGFNLGIELGQIVVLSIAAVMLTVLDALIARLPLPDASPSPLRVRVVAVSALVAVVAARWAVQRAPW